TRCAVLSSYCVGIFDGGLPCRTAALSASTADCSRLVVIFAIICPDTGLAARLMATTIEFTSLISTLDVSVTLLPIPKHRREVKKKAVKFAATLDPLVRVERSRVPTTIYRGGGSRCRYEAADLRERTDQVSPGSWQGNCYRSLEELLAPTTRLCLERE